MAAARLAQALGMEPDFDLYEARYLMGGAAVALARSDADDYKDFTVMLDGTVVRITENTRAACGGGGPPGAGALCRAGAAHRPGPDRFARHALHRAAARVRQLAWCVSRGCRRFRLRRFGSWSV
ncbi:hypothetical protein LP420_04785 [Massilia sp. B-10]|nr:hypothetical protein LP420_04785 [Massilia sp. B-10]